MNNLPIYPASLVVGMGQISTANTNRDGTGTLVDIVTAGANGTRIDRVTITATGTTTAGAVRFFVNDGTNSRLIDEVLISAITPSTTVKVAYVDYVRADGKPICLLPPGGTWKFKAATNNAEPFNVVAYGGDY